MSMQLSLEDTPPPNATTPIRRHRTPPSIIPPASDERVLRRPPSSFWLPSSTGSGENKWALETHQASMTIPPSAKRLCQIVVRDERWSPIAKIRVAPSSFSHGWKRTEEGWADTSEQGGVEVGPPCRGIHSTVPSLADVVGLVESRDPRSKSSRRKRNSRSSHA